MPRSKSEAPMGMKGWTDSERAEWEREAKSAKSPAQKKVLSGYVEKLNRGKTQALQAQRKIAGKRITKK